jgi:shikimate kinase
MTDPRSPHLVSLSACHLVIFLVGYRGTGKTAVARLLAERLGWNWVDADVVLEDRAGQSIRAIFTAEGEAGFRRRETALLEELSHMQRHVIATGGGVILNASNRERMRAAGQVVWLTADAETIWQRLQEDASTTERRPALTVGGLAEVRELLQLREPLYLACADWTVNTVGRTPEQVAQEIISYLRRQGSDVRGQ